MKKAFILFPLVLAALLLSACSSGGTAVHAVGTTTQAGTPGPDAGNGIEGRLALGTLALEGTGDAVTVEQAKILLPLWKAVNALTTSDTTTEEEIASLYKQIQASMTDSQIAAIKALDLSGDAVSTLMAKYMPIRDQTGGSGTAEGQFTFPGGGDFQPPTGGGNFQPPSGGGGPSFSQGGGGGRAQFGGGEVPGGRVIIQNDGTGAQSPVESTPGAGSAMRMRGAGMNIMFVQPLITLLKERAG